MVKIQFMKLKISNYCCSSQLNNETSIVEWCVMDIKDFWTMIAKELKFDKYVNDEKSLKKLQNKLLEYGRVRDVGCENCRKIYLFQRMNVKLSGCLNKSINGYCDSDNSMWLQSDDIKSIEDIANKLFDMKEEKNTVKV